MEESKIMSELKRNRILVWCALIGTLGTFIAIGTLLVSAGELKKSISTTETSQTQTLAKIDKISDRLVGIEVGQEKRAIKDSVRDIDIKEMKVGVKDLQARMTKMEWLHQQQSGVHKQPLLNYFKTPYGVAQPVN